MLNLAKQSDAIGSPLSQPDRRVHKKVHLHNDARARDLPELRWVRCAPTSASREISPFCCSSLSMPFPRPIPVAVRPAPPQSAARRRGERESAVSSSAAPIFVANHSFNRTARNEWGAPFVQYSVADTPLFDRSSSLTSRGQSAPGGCVLARPRSV